MIDIETTIRIRCDVCAATFLYVTTLESAMPARPNTPDQSALAFLEVANAIGQLRELADQAGWTYILPVARPEADLCPDCYTLPPEG